MLEYRYFGGSRTLAWLTLTEIGVWLAVTIISLSGKIMAFSLPVAEWLTLPSSLPIFATRPWTILTYIFVHFDVLHILFNVLWLYWFGRMLMITLSDRHLLLSFLGGGVSGGLLFLLSSVAGYGGGWLCGCSAAVISVMCLAAIRTPGYPVRLLLIGEVKLKWVAIVCCVLTFIGGGGNQAAHIGGLLWGVALGVLLKNGKDPAAWITAARNFFPPREKARKRSGTKMAKVLRDRHTDMQRLDQLLDKIKLSGYESLSRKERKELNELSARLK